MIAAGSSSTAFFSKMREPPSTLKIAQAFVIGSGAVVGVSRRRQSALTDEAALAEVVVWRVKP